MKESTLVCTSINPQSSNEDSIWPKEVFVKYADMKNKLFVVQYLMWFEEVPYPMCIVTEELPPCNSLEVGVKILCLRHGVKEKWPNSLKKIRPQLSIPKEALHQRSAYDFRNKRVFTVSSSPNQDCDCALHIERLSDTEIQLGVHLSDVAYFIAKDTPLDKEAQKRATTFYNDLPNAASVASHILPEQFSTNLCVFKPGEDRLAVSIILTVDETSGNVASSDIARSVVRCKQNLTYKQVENFLSNDYDGELEFWKNCMEQLEMLNKVAMFLPSVSSLQTFKDKDFVKYPSAVTLFQKLKALVNDKLATKLEALPGPKLVYRESPAKEEDLRAWGETFKEDASKLLNPPSTAMKSQVENDAKRANSNNDEFVPILKETHRDINHVLQYGKDKIFDLEKILGCVGRYPNQTAALAQLWAITPIKELVSTESTSANHSYPFIAPLKSYSDLVTQRLLIACLEGTQNPYFGEDLSQIAYHCFRQMQNAKSYAESVEMLLFAMKLKEVPHCLTAVVHSASDENLQLTYPFAKFLQGSKDSTSVAQCHLKPGKRLKKVDKKERSIQIHWRNRIYDYKTDQVKQRSQNTKLWLSTHEHIHHVPIDLWRQTIRTVQEKSYLDLGKLEEQWTRTNQPQPDRKDVHEDNLGEVIREVTCEKVKTKERSFELKYVEFNRQFNPGDVVQVHLTSKVHHGIPAPSIQHFKLTPKYGICLEHRALPVECFTEVAEKLPLSCSSVEEYISVWSPILKMLTAYSTIMNDETIVIHDVSIEWFKKKADHGRFTLEKKWCDDRQIIFSVLPKWKKSARSGPSDPTEKSLLSDYICIRLHGYPVTGIVRSNLEKLGSKDQSASLETDIALPSEATILVHGIAGTTNIGRPSDKENYEVEFQVTQVSCELPDSLFESKKPVTCTIELIPKSEPEK